MSWHGLIAGSDDPVTLLWWPSGRLSGQITYRGHQYVVKNLGGAMHGIIEMAPRKLPPEHAPMTPNLMHKMHMDKDPLVTNGDASMLRKPTSELPDETKEPIRNLQDAAPKSGGKPADQARAYRAAAQAGRNKARAGDHRPARRLHRASRIALYRYKKET